MKCYLIIASTTILLSSCLKQSIPDAMLGKKSGGQAGTSATLSYEVNGNAVNISVKDADRQDPNSYTLGVTKAGYYILDGISNSGEITFSFYTDSLKVGNYNYTSIYGDMYYVWYNGVNEYVHAGSDNMSL